MANRKKDKYILSGKNLEIAEKMLFDVTSIFEKHQISYWIDFGTLLGIAREGRILPWDDDMDISILEKDRQKVHEVVLPEIKQLNYRTYTRYHDIGDDILKDEDFRVFRVRNNRWKFFRGYVKIDIFVMYDKDDYHYWYELGHRHRLPSSLISDFDNIEFKGKMYRKPKDHDAYLSYHYGNWREPRPDYNSEIDGLKTAIKE